MCTIARNVFQNDSTFLDILNESEKIEQMQQCDGSEIRKFYEIVPFSMFP